MVSHLGLEVAGENAARNAAEVDAEVADLRSVRNGKIGGHANQQLVQHQTLRPKYDELIQAKTREALQLIRDGNTGKDVLRPEYRRERPQVLGHLRQDAGIPGSGDLFRVHVGAHLANDTRWSPRWLNRRDCDAIRLSRDRQCDAVATHWVVHIIHNTAVAGDIGQAVI